MGHEVVVVPGGGQHVCQQGCDLLLVTRGAQVCQLLLAILLEGRVHLEQVECDLFFLLEGVDADYDLFAGFDLFLELVEADSWISPWM